MPSSRFDPDPHKPYGSCITCDLELATEADAETHRAETLQSAIRAGLGRAGHTTRATNPSREARIRSRISSIVHDAVTEALEEVQELVDSGDITQTEAEEALGVHPDFVDQWLERD